MKIQKVLVFNLIIIFIFALSLFADEREEFHKIVDLKKGGKLILENINGSITISSWDKNQVDIFAVKSTKEKYREELKETEIEVHSTEDSLTIRTKYLRRFFIRSNHVSVRYELKVPKEINLEKIKSVNGEINISDIIGSINTFTTNGKILLSNLKGKANVSTTNGAINVENFSGELEAETTNGSISLEISQLKNRLEAATVNGSIKVYLSPEIDADFEAKTVNGGISCDFPVRIKKLGFLGRKLEGKIGRGGNLIYLRTVNGSIKIYESK
ncbi:MAG: DUF4097 domain-containing protein [Candidatus Aminicenantia bacterium]